MIVAEIRQFSYKDLKKVGLNPKCDKNNTKKFHAILKKALKSSIIKSMFMPKI